MTRTAITLQSHDGHALAGYCHQPARAPLADLVIAPAMAVPQSFYADFAAFCARQGYRVWTFDYRGMSESRQGSMRACTADITDWVLRDYDAVVQHVVALPERLPLFVLGHSLGGQLTPLLPSRERIDGLVNIAVGSGAVRHNQPQVRRRAPMLWFITPLLCTLFGYFPGKRIGIMGDIPRRAMAQWRSWCMTPDYMLSGEPGAREAYASARYPVLGLTFVDDELLLESGSRMMHEAYASAAVDYRELSPQQFKLPRIGHFGFFKANQETVLWPLVCNWLAERIGMRSAASPA